MINASIVSCRVLVGHMIVGFARITISAILGELVIATVLPWLASPMSVIAQKRHGH